MYVASTKTLISWSSQNIDLFLSWSDTLKTRKQTNRGTGIIIWVISIQDYVREKHTAHMRKTH